jgi:iron complex transport system ATP-binding protein
MELKLENVRFQYASLPVIDHVTIDLACSQIAAICGPNGVGKSTLIKCINRILKADGRIRLGDRDIHRMKMRELAKRIGYVPQAIANVFSITVFDMVLMGRRPHLGWRQSSADEDKVIDVLKLLGIDGFAMQDFNEISGGQQQKVIIARALAQEPEILLMDEPTSNLDLFHQLEVMEIVRRLVAEKQISVIMAIHDLNLASRYADKIIMMKSGEIHCAGESASVLTSENILSVYGVIAEVKKARGYPYIIPIGPDPNKSRD